MISKFYAPGFLAFFILIFSLVPTKADPMIACSMEAKLCPDGSAVSRTGPQCAFAPCPSGSLEQPGVERPGMGYVLGKTVVSPATSSMRNGEASARPISGQIIVLDTNDNVVKQVASDAQGHFRIDLPEGQYTLQLSPPYSPSSSVGFGSSRTQTITIRSGKATQTQLTLDAGIR